MKKLLLSILLGLSLFASPSFGREIVNVYHHDKKDVVVYITRTGHKYHRESCRYLRQSKIRSTKRDAINQGLTACSVCNP